MRSSIITTAILLTIVLPSSGQKSTGTVPSGDLFLKLNNLNFIRNNEYSNPIIEGYTLIGYFLQPEVLYTPDEKVALSFGGNLLSYAGTNRFNKIKPVFSTTFWFSDSIFLRIGSLGGSDEHRLADPHFSKERIYSNYSEDGLRFRAAGRNYFNDTWLSWENFIFKGDDKREIFTAGESFRYSFPEIAGILKIEVPVQLLVKHYGGQISDYPENVESCLNTASGISAGINTVESLNGTAGIDFMFFTWNSLRENSPTGINKGHAAWYRLFYTCRNASLKAGYWNSQDYYAPDGNFIFSSASDRFENSVIPNREILTCSFEIAFPWKDFLKFSFGFEGFYDTRLRRFDNAMTLHARFGKMVKLVSLKGNNDYR